jgi:Arc/MetJ-type ribon-helix-helix transcriptional regulator
MSSVKRLSKKPTSYKLPIDIEILLQNAVEGGEYNNTSDVITTALRFFFQHRDIQQVKEEVSLLKSEVVVLNSKNQLLEKKLAGLEDRMQAVLLSSENPE